MVQTFQLSGLAAVANAGLSLGAFIGQERVAVLTAIRHIMRRSYSLAAHSHGFTGNALAAHSHNAFAAACIGASNNAAAHKLMWSAGLIVTSIAHGAVPWTNGVTGGTPAGVLGGVTGGVNMGITSTARTVDSNGRYVAEATHPAVGHVVLKHHGAAGPRIELGDAIRAGDILQITVLMLAQSGGIF